MSALADSSGALIDATSELDRISKELVRTEIGIEELEPQVEQALEDFIAGLWETHEKEGTKLPPADVREKLSWKALDTDLKANYRAHLAARRRAKSRLSDLREIVAAHRSIVSAAKTEMEASEGPQPAWTGAS
jgi:predicted  nucleic acid-binding Zn-ribbon protein